MSRYGVSTAKENALNTRMAKLNLLEDDLEENFIRGSGSGGQKINKTSSCVQLLHLPSRIEVRCQKSRSQALNRYYARVILCEKLEDKLLGQQSEKQQAIEKVKRQKRKRSKRAKEKLLKNKKANAVKKELRKKPNAD